MEPIRYQTVEQNGKRFVQTIHQIIAYRFKVSDVEDPYLYIASPLADWEKSDKGSFIMKHSVTQPRWERNLNLEFMGHDFIIIAELEESKLSEYYLRWGNPNERI